MMNEKLKTIIHDYRFLICSIGLLCLCCGYSSSMDTAIAVLIALLSLFVNLANCFLLVLVADIFQVVLHVDALGGSVVRILIPVFLLRVGLYFIKKKNFPKICTREWLILGFILASFGFGLVSRGFTSEGVRMLINFGFFWAAGIWIKNEFGRETVGFAKEIINTLVISILFGIMYGLIHKGVIISNGVIRFEGVIGPNQMSFLINFALMNVLVFNSLTSNRILKILLILFLNASLLITVSMTGMLVFLFVYAVYIMWAGKKEIGRRFSKACAIALVTIILALVAFTVFAKIMGFSTVSSSTVDFINNPIVERLVNSFRRLMSGNFDSLSSGRLPIQRAFLSDWKTKGFVEKLFGNGLDDKLVYTERYKQPMYSHNVYLDILYNHGIIGACLVFFYLGWLLVKGSFLEIQDKEIKKQFRFMRIMYMIAFLTVSLGNVKTVLLLFLFF